MEHIIRKIDTPGNEDAFDLYFSIGPCLWSNVNIESGEYPLTITTYADWHVLNLINRIVDAYDKLYLPSGGGVLWQQSIIDKALKEGLYFMAKELEALNFPPPNTDQETT